MKIGFSVLDFSFLVFLTRLKGLKSLTVHESSLVNSNLILGTDQNGQTTVLEHSTEYNIQPNYSLQTLKLYKN